MAAHDSESSDEADDYTQTNVLLGFASTEETGDSVSHLGGAPTWMNDQSRPDGALAKCKVCNGLLSLLLELNGDMPDRFPNHERRLYIWTCRRSTCRRKEGSVRGMRGVRLAPGTSSKPTAQPTPDVTHDQKPPPSIGASLFGVPSATSAAPVNPFSSKPSSVKPFSTSSPSPQAKSEPASQEPTPTLPDTFASKLRLASPPPSAQPPRPHEPWPTASLFPAPFPYYHLDAEYETLDVPSAPQIPENVRMDMDIDGGESGRGKEDKEVFESSIDKAFQKFADRIGENPEQALRYEFRGKPLLYSDNDKAGKLLAQNSEKGPSANAKITTAGSKAGPGFPRCHLCAAERVFEVQLTPHAIIDLEANDMTLDGMEWGTIIMAVCGKDCKPSDVPDGEVGYVEEWIGVQWEEVLSKK